jgi:hypothetical protein
MVKNIKIAALVLVACLAAAWVGGIIWDRLTSPAYAGETTPTTPPKLLANGEEPLTYPIWIGQLFWPKDAVVPELKLGHMPYKTVYMVEPDGLVLIKRHPQAILLRLKVQKEGGSFKVTLEPTNMRENEGVWRIADVGEHEQIGLIIKQ